MSKTVAVVDILLPQGEAILKTGKKAPYGLNRSALLDIASKMSKNNKKDFFVFFIWQNIIRIKEPALF